MSSAVIFPGDSDDQLVSSFFSREEIKLRLLLDKTEERMAEFAACGKIVDPKINFYVKQLWNWLEGLERHAHSPSEDVLCGFRSRVAFLQRVLDDLNPPKDPVPRLGLDLPFLGLTATSPVLVAGGRASGKKSTTEKDEDNEEVVVKRLPQLETKPFRPISRALGDNNTKARIIHQKREQRHLLDEREELFEESDSQLRQRHTATVPGARGPADSELSDLLKAHHQAQEQVAEEMLGLTRALKEQSLAAGEIIRKDTAVLEKTSEAADKNTTRLGIESARLSEHTKTGCRCWIWFVLLVVTITFIAMVMVMKVFRKRTWT